MDDPVINSNSNSNYVYWHADLKAGWLADELAQKLVGLKNCRRAKLLAHIGTNL